MAHARIIHTTVAPNPTTQPEGWHTRCDDDTFEVVDNNALWAVAICFHPDNGHLMMAVWDYEVGDEPQAVVDLAVNPGDAGAALEPYGADVSEFVRSVFA